MHREMRRKDRQITHDEAMELLKNAEYGTLATVNADNMPYAVPLNHVVDNNTIYFHMARQGQKLENIMKNPNVMFTVIGTTEPVKEEDSYSTFFESAMAFGKARIVEDLDEGKRALYILTEKYFPNDMDMFEKSTTGDWMARLYVIAMDIEHVSGKAKRKI